MKISIVTSNVSADFLDPPGVPTWDERKLLFVNVLLGAEPDIIGLQEVMPGQLQFLQTQLPEFAPLTVPISNPTADLLAAFQEKYQKYGFSEIPNPSEIVLFYRKDTFDLVSTGHWWLSPTPDVPSIGFGNIAPRVVLWAHFHHTASKKEVVVFNTHIDHRSTISMVDLCRMKFAVFAEHYSTLFLLGDLNFNEQDANYDLLIADGWNDSYQAAHETDGSTFLFTRADLPYGRIDHILYRSKECTPKIWKRLLPTDASQRISDHDPVCAEFQVG